MGLVRDDPYGIKHFFGNFPFFLYTRIFKSVQTVELSPWPFWLGKRRKTYWPEFVAVVVFYPLISSRENDEYLMNENKKNHVLHTACHSFPWIIFRNVVSGFLFLKKQNTTPFFSGRGKEDGGAIIRQIVAWLAVLLHTLKECHVCHPLRLALRRPPSLSRWSYFTGAPHFIFISLTHPFFRIERDKYKKRKRSSSRWKKKKNQKESII